MGDITRSLLASAIFIVAISISGATAQKKYDPGATDTEITVGNIVPYTGQFSEYGANGRAEAAYFRMINDRGGINGRKINFISLDFNSDPNKSVELAHQLVERDQVLLTVGIWGTPTNLAIRQYMNEKKVPQLFVAAPDPAFDDPSHFPWTMGFQVTKRIEGEVYADYVRRNRPNAKVAILYSHDSSGQEWLRGLKEGFGNKESTMIVKEMSFAYSDAQLFDAQIIALKDSGADVFMNMTVGRFATEAIRKSYDIDWHPLQFIPNASISIEAFLDPAGLEKSEGIIANARSKGWRGSRSRQDPAVRDFLEWMARYNPQASLRDFEYVYGYEVAQTLVEVLKKCGDNLTRENVMKQATSLDLQLGMLRPGIRITTSPTDYQPIKQLFLVQFDGENWNSIDK